MPNTQRSRGVSRLQRRSGWAVAALARARHSVPAAAGGASAQRTRDQNSAGLPHCKGSVTLGLLCTCVFGSTRQPLNCVCACVCVTVRSDISWSPAPGANGRAGLTTVLAQCRSRGCRPDGRCHDQLPLARWSCSSDWWCGSGCCVCSRLSTCGRRALLWRVLAQGSG